MAAHKVLYYTLDGDVTLASRLLDERGAAGAIELVGCAHEPFALPTTAQLEGMEGFVGEFAPLKGETVDRLAAAGVRLVVSHSIGLNHMDVDALDRAGIIVTNCPGYCAEDVALHALALTLDLARKVTFSNRSVIEGRWEPKAGYSPRRVQGQTMGLVFFGHIGREMARLSRALGMKVLVWAPTKTADELAEAGCEKAETLDDLLAAADVVSLHCPLIPETEHLIGARELSLMKPTAFLVNTARGDLIDEDALVAALDAGTIRGAGLDTLHSESTDRDPRLIGHPRVIVTPHTGYDSVEASENLVRMGVESLCEFFVDGARPRYAVV